MQPHRIPLQDHLLQEDQQQYDMSSGNSTASISTSGNRTTITIELDVREARRLVDAWSWSDIDVFFSTPTGAGNTHVLFPKLSERK